VSIRRIDQSKELRKIGRPGVTGAEEAPPTGLSPILRSSWNFARDTAKRFSKELGADRTGEFLKNLAKRFS
jgi:hypothetical protein